MLLAGRARRIGEVAGHFGVGVGRLIGQCREEGEVVHAHRHQAFGDRLVVFLEEGLAPVRRREGIERAIGLKRRDGLAAN